MNGPLVEEHLDMVLFDPERLFCFMLEGFQLKEKALHGDVLHVICGDGTDIYTSTNFASQCEFGIKVIDCDAINRLGG